MGKIDSSSWMEFKTSDIFDMKNTNSIVQRSIVLDSGKIPYVTASSINNGILSYISCPEEWKDKGNCIMIGGKTLAFSYQEQDFCSNDSHNIALYLKNENKANKYVYLFLISALKASLYSRYRWSDSISMRKIKQESLMLPVTDDNNPNWEFMESHMEAIINKSKDSIESLISRDSRKSKIDTSSWGRFHLYDDDLFDIDMGTKLDKVKMTEISPSINFVGRANANNGITGKVDRVENVDPYKAGNMSLSLGGEYLGSCFIQPENFYTSQNVIVLIPRWNMPDMVKHFIATMIFRESRMYYKAFVDELNRHIKTDFSFYLPIDEHRNPDWSYMETCMTKYFDMTAKNISDIKSYFISKTTS